MKAIVISVIAIGVCGSAWLAKSGFQTGAVSMSKRQLPYDAPAKVRMRRVSELNRQANEAWTRDHDFVAAQAKYLDALRLQPNDGMVLYDYAHCCDAAGKTQEAFDAYAALLHPPSTQSSSAESDPLVLARYAEIAEAVGEPQESAWGFAQASRFGSKRGGFESLPPPNAENPIAIKTRALLIASEAARKRDEDNSSTLLLQRAVALSPNSPEVNYYLGQSLLRQGRKTEAANRFKRCRELAPNGSLASEAAFLEKRHRPGSRKVFAHDSQGNLVEVTTGH